LHSPKSERARRREEGGRDGAQNKAIALARVGGRSLEIGQMRDQISWGVSCLGGATRLSVLSHAASGTELSGGWDALCSPMQRSVVRGGSGVLDASSVRGVASVLLEVG
jgi:hypothetical protein